MYKTCKTTGSIHISNSSMTNLVSKCVKLDILINVFSYFAKVRFCVHLCSSIFALIFMVG